MRSRHNFIEENARLLAFLARSAYVDGNLGKSQVSLGGLMQVCSGNPYIWLQEDMGEKYEVALPVIPSYDIVWVNNLCDRLQKGKFDEIFPLSLPKELLNAITFSSLEKPHKSAIIGGKTYIMWTAARYGIRQFWMTPEDILRGLDILRLGLILDRFSEIMRASGIFLEIDGNYSGKSILTAFSEEWRKELLGRRIDFSDSSIVRCN